MPTPALDRTTPAQRASCPPRASGVQTWRDLLFVHWAMDPERLRALLPPEVAVDTYEGRAYVGLVPFTMAAVRFGPLPVPDFLEMNLRTYVHAGGVPGVWFFSLDAESRLAVAGARLLYRLPYFRARMECRVNEGTAEYRSERVRAERATSGRAARADLRWSVLDGEPHHAAPESLEHFLTERYALYGQRRRGSLYRLRVHHAPWPLHRARLERLDQSVLIASGVEVDSEPIDLVLASPRGVAVETFAAEGVQRTGGQPSPG